MYIFGTCGCFGCIGNAAQWRWFVPHDVPSLINLFQSQDHFVEELDKFFDKSEEHRSNILPNPYYWWVGGLNWEEHGRNGATGPHKTIYIQCRTCTAISDALVHAPPVLYWSRVCVAGAVLWVHARYSYAQSLAHMLPQRCCVCPCAHRSGNEPDLLAVYLFCFAGRADLTQKVNVASRPSETCSKVTTFNCGMPVLLYHVLVLPVMLLIVHDTPSLWPLSTMNERREMHACVQYW